MQQVAALTKPAHVDALLQRCGGGEGARGKERAAWGACILLFTDKPATPPLFKSLAAQYAGKLVRPRLESPPGSFTTQEPLHPYTLCPEQCNKG